MAVTTAFLRGFHVRLRQKNSFLKQPCRTYIPVSSSILQHPYRTDTHRQPLNALHLKYSNPSALDLRGYIQQRHISRETFAYYMSSDNPPIGFAEKLFQNVHDVTGLPWWAAILLTTWGLRGSITVPLAVYTSHVMARLEKLRPEMGEIAKQLKAEVMWAKKQKGWTEKEAYRQFKINMKRLTKEMYIRENCHPAKTTVLAWVQIPMWVSLSLALRNMSGALPVKGVDNVVSAPGLADEGLLWIPNLLLADTTFVLPVIVGVLNLAIIEMHALKPGTPSRLQKGVTYALRGLSVVMIPIAASLPSCMAFYWACSSFFGLGQNILLKVPSVRRALGIPRLANDSDAPFRDMAALARTKYGRKTPTDSAGKS